MYESYWHLKLKPFDSCCDPRFYFPGESHQAALLKLRYAVENQRGAAVLAAAAVTLHAFWFDPVYRADDHRAAVAELSRRWRPGDVLLVNAGWPYTAVATYWDGAIAGRYRITGALPEARPDDALVMVTTGHVDGDASLGWGDLRSDFFAMPGQVA